MGQRIGVFHTTHNEGTRGHGVSRFEGVRRFFPLAWLPNFGRRRQPVPLSSRPCTGNAWAGWDRRSGGVLYAHPQGEKEESQSILSMSSLVVSSAWA